MHCSMTGCKIRTIEIYRTINDFSLSQLNVQMVTMYAAAHSRYTATATTARQQRTRLLRFEEKQSEKKCLPFNCSQYGGWSKKFAFKQAVTSAGIAVSTHLLRHWKLMGLHGEIKCVVYLFAFGEASAYAYLISRASKMNARRRMTLNEHRVCELSQRTHGVDNLHIYNFFLWHSICDAGSDSQSNF